MLTEFVIVSFATFIGWQIFKSLAWFNVPARLTNFLVPAIAYGMTWLSHPSFLIALAATGGCAIVFRFIAHDSIEPWRLPARNKRPARDRNPANLRRKNPDKNRIPRL